MITAIIQARMSSTRLPGKVLLKLGRQTVLEHVIARAQAAKLISKVIVATSIDERDNQIAELCLENNIEFYRGSLDDVLDRYYQTAKKYGVEHICRLTADCPLIDPEVIDLVIKKYQTGDYDLVSNSHPVATFPDGYDLWIFSFVALEKAWREAKLSSEREHVTSYIWNNPDKFKTYNLKNNIDLSKYRLTIDEEKDYQLLKLIVENNSDLSMKSVLGYLKSNQNVKNLNASIKRDEGYYKSLAKDKEFINIRD